MNLTIKIRDDVTVNGEITIKEINLSVDYEATGKRKRYLSKEAKNEILKAVGRKLDVAGLENSVATSFTTEETSSGKVENFVWGLLEDKLSGFDKTLDQDEKVKDFIKRIDYPASEVSIKAFQYAYKARYTHLNEITHIVWQCCYAKPNSEYTSETIYDAQKKEQNAVSDALRADFKKWKYYPLIKDYYPGVSVAILFRIFLKVAR